jgi:hypoxanthine phosphoribosyltransferase
MVKVLYDPFQIEEVAFGVADHFNKLYNKDNESDVIFAPILQGAVPFFSDIARNLTFDPYVEFIGVSSYKGEQQKEFHLYKMIEPNLVRNKTIWLFDDIADSGNTLRFLSDMLKQFGAKEVKSCVLLKKRHCTYPVDVTGFEMDDEWVFGYGMDAPNGRGRLSNAIFYEEK